MPGERNCPELDATGSESSANDCELIRKMGQSVPVSVPENGKGRLLGALNLLIIKSLKRVKGIEPSYIIVGKYAGRKIFHSLDPASP
jgi:hypothetical protein